MDFIDRLHRAEYTLVELPPVTREMTLEKMPDLAWRGRYGSRYGTLAGKPNDECRSIAEYHYNGGEY